MSGLWDYDDDNDLQDAGSWELPSPVEVAEEEVKAANNKRKGGKKAAGGRTKRRAAASPVTDLAALKQPPQTAPILLVTSDEEDDLVILPSPLEKSHGGPAGTSATAPTAASPLGACNAPGPSGKAAVDHLNSATQQTLAKERELLSALRQVTSMQQDDVDLDDLDGDPGPLPSVNSMARLLPLGLPRLSTRLPSDAMARGSGGGAGSGTDTDAGGSRCGLAAETAGGSAVVRPVGAHGSQREPAAAAEPDGGAACSAAMADTADRVRLKLVWSSGKDGYLFMRVVKTDPLSKMMAKFREIAAKRQLCRDPKKIRFMFEGDDLMKTPNTTPEDLDLEDDMMIDVKL